MPVLGAVLVLDTAPERAAEALAILSTDPRVEVGPPCRERLPVVLTTTSRAEDRDLWDSLCALPGVTHLDLVFADFRDLESVS